MVLKEHQPAKYANHTMAPNYPDLPDSPTASSSKKNNSKTSKKAPPASPLSTTEELEEFDQYEVRRSAIGTGIFSSLFTLSVVRNQGTHVPIPLIIIIFL